MHKALKKYKIRALRLICGAIKGYALLASWSIASADDLSTTTLRFDRPGLLNGTVDFNYDAFPQSNEPYYGGAEKAAGLPSVGASVVGQSHDNFVDARWLYSSQEDFHYFDIKEASHNFHRENYNLWFGRHYEEWSQADTFWRLGYWQPRFNWDKLRPDENGLTGIFVQPELANSVKLSIFVSPVFLPELGVNFREQNGRLVSYNPWFKTPPPIVDLFKRNTPVDVTVDTPTVSDTVFKPSVALRTELYSEDDTWVRASYAYKPINTPVIGYSYQLQTLPTSTQMDAVVEPQFVYHHIATVESQIKAGDVAIVPSITYDAPQLPSVPEQWISQDLAPSVIASLTFSWRPDGSRRNVFYSGVMYDWQNFPPDRGENAQADSQFELRPTWLSAVRVGFDHTKEQSRGREFGYGVEGTVDPRQNGGTLLSQVRYRWDRQWQARARADLVGVFSDASNPYETGFVQTYHSNSTVGLDLSYVY